MSCQHLKGLLIVRRSVVLKMPTLPLEVLRKPLSSNGINSPRYMREPSYSLALFLEISQVSNGQEKHNAS